MAGELASSHASATCGTVASCRSATFSRRAGSIGSLTAAKREKRHEGDTSLGALCQQGRVAGVVVHVEGVLHGGHRGNRAGLGELGGVDVADAQVADEALVAQRGQRREAVTDRFAAGPVLRADAQVDQVEPVNAELAEVLLRLGRAAVQALPAGPGTPSGPSIGPTLVAITRPRGRGPAPGGSARSRRRRRAGRSSRCRCDSRPVRRRDAGRRSRPADPVPGR